MTRIKLHFLLIICFSLCFFQCDKMKKKHIDAYDIEEKIEIDSAMVSAKQNFQLHCTGCHGQQMEAFVDRKWKHGKSLDSLKLSILNGYVDAGMPAWKAMFSEEDVDNLIKYISSGIEKVEKYGFQRETLESDTIITENLTVKLDTVFSGIEVPWDMNWLPNEDMLITERSGKLYRLNTAGSTFEIKGVPQVRAKTQGGLFEVLPHPEFSTNNYVYLSYSNLKVVKGDTTTTTMVSRFTLKDDILKDKKLILEAAPYNKRHVHFGAKMLFDKDGYLFITVGDRGERDVNPQDLSKPAGKIHRFYADGTIPEDNPFVNTPDAVKSIYSYGHRNPQGIAIHPKTEALWEHEHGPRGGDELNIIEPKKNYGWPVISYGINYDGTIFTSELEKDGMEQPLHYWVPSIAPCGMAFVTSDKYKGWEGNLMVGSLRFEYLNRCVIEGNKVVKEENILKGIGRLRTVEQGPDGYLYVAVEKPGYIFRLKPINN
jgi:glucose/arabinose dehydrogenase